ncbi:pyridoxamine 5'-phosphate oxidase family protein [Pseudonocardia sp.]|uniref:pyridoxamine 5'-phosphate oxidase family protein n=1 Tax=Pseudonocardia sp. TaxID=60912 RepID=UPI003D0CCE3B
MEHAIDASPAGVRALEPIPRSRCLELLVTVPIGRVVFTEDALPAVHPVNFALAGEDVIVRTAAGHKLTAARRGDLLAFQADHIDPETRTGWSVLVIGRASEVTDVDELVAAIDLSRRPWAPGRGGHVIRIAGERITGRRLVLGGSPA